MWTEPDQLIWISHKVGLKSKTFLALAVEGALAETGSLQQLKAWVEAVLIFLAYEGIFFENLGPHFVPLFKCKTLGISTNEFDFQKEMAL